MATSSYSSCRSARVTVYFLKEKLTWDSSQVSFRKIIEGYVLVVKLVEDLQRIHEVVSNRMNGLCEQINESQWKKTREWLRGKNITIIMGNFVTINSSRNGITNNTKNQKKCNKLI